MTVPPREHPYPDVDPRPHFPALEEEILAYWAADNTFVASVEQRSPEHEFVFYDGPPFANGLPHYGHLLTGFVKDAVPRYQAMRGRRVTRRFGWDCHGLPIEQQVDKKLGSKKREMSVADFCRACRAYAQRFIGTMTEQFQRLGILATWNAPYLTMNYRYEAAIARAFGKFVEQDLVYKGKKPVHWCIHCRTALAEAEVEYEDHTSPSIYVEFPLAPDGAGELAVRHHVEQHRAGRAQQTDRPAQDHADADQRQPATQRPVRPAPRHVRARPCCDPVPELPRA